MTNNYPLIFKRTVLNFYKREDTKVKDVLKTFNISKSTLFNWVNLEKNNNLVEKAKYKKKNIKSNEEVKQWIKNYVIKRVNFECKLLILSIKRKFRITLKKSSIYLVLSELGITNKKIKDKKIYGDKNKLKKKIEEFKKDIAKISHDSIISVDEVSIDTNINQTNGWSEKGKKIHREVKANRVRYTIICAISNKKIIGYRLVKGSANATDFLNFLKEELNEINNKFILLDNARIHHSKIIEEYMKTSTNEFIFNVPYMPEFNPIEKVFSVFKNNIKKKDNSGVYNLKKNIKEGFESIKKKYLKNFYNKSLVSFL